MPARRVLVIGGGIAGLAAAVDLVDDSAFEVELWEASDRLGGKIATSPFAGLEHIDEAADSYLTRVPDAVAFAERVGLQADDLTAPTDATAMVWHGALHDIPGGTVLGVPAAIGPLVTTSLLSWKGKLRAAGEPFLPRTDPDDSLGRLIRARFGDEVHERLVDSLVGSIYATDTDHSSLAAVPQLADLASKHRSLLLGGIGVRRRAQSPDSPIFGAPRHGMARLIDAAEAYVIAHRGTIDTDRAASTIEPDGNRWRVDGERFDAVVLAAPAPASASLLATAFADASAGLGSFEHADVIMVRLTVAGEAWPEQLRGRSGYLVPKPVQRHVTAASFASQKWDHWAPADGSQILRVSLGRDGLPIDHLDDDSALGAAVDETGHHLGFDLQPGETSLTRWNDAFAQYRPHHHRSVADLEAMLPPTIGLVGASYNGIGIPACISGAQRAVARIKETTPEADQFLT